MSYQITTQVNPHLTGMNPLAIQSGQQNAETQVTPQQDRTIAMLDQTFEIIEEQNNAVKAEYTLALEQAQNTIANLQSSQQALLRQNALQASQITILQSQNNQMSTTHQADMKAAQERIGLLQKENDRLKKTVEIYKKGFSNVETAYNQYKIEVENGDLGTLIIESLSATPISRQFVQTKQELLNLSMGKL